MSKTTTSEEERNGAVRGELVFGIASTIGAGVDTVVQCLEASLDRYSFVVGAKIRFSVFLDPLIEPKASDETPEERMSRLMDAGNQMRETSEDYLASVAAAGIKGWREVHGANSPRAAHIVRTMKHPMEVALLRRIYGNGFYLIGISAPRHARESTLADTLDVRKSMVGKLIDRDLNEGIPHGQKTRDTFELADFFLQFSDHRTDQDEHSKKVESLKEKVNRFVDLIMGSPYTSPTHDEYCMYMAFAAALQSRDLSRQVGAVITNKDGYIVGTGQNDVPVSPISTSNLGQADISAVRISESDFQRGYDANEKIRDEIVGRVLEAILDAEQIPEDKDGRKEMILRYRKKLKPTGILDITEFHRAVHAEMTALMACLNLGVSVRDGVLYCTTYPCHNCAKHIIAAGLKKVVYVEAYPKSRALELHGDMIHDADKDAGSYAENGKLVFMSFEGVGPRRFLDLFSMSLGSGDPVQRKAEHSAGAITNWSPGPETSPRLPLDERSFIDRETSAAARVATEDGPQSVQ